MVDYFLVCDFTYIFIKKINTFEKYAKAVFMSFTFNNLNVNISNNYIY